MKRFFIIVLMLLSSVAQAEHKPIQDFVNELYKETYSVFQSNLSDTVKQEKIKNIILKVSDIEGMAKFTLGAYKRDISTDDLASFIKVYKDYIISNYSTLFRKFRDQQLAIKNISDIGNNKYNVVTEITDSNNVINVSFIVIDKASQYKILDLVTEGVSLITSQRSEFNSILGTGGIKALINELKELQETVH